MTAKLYLLRGHKHTVRHFRYRVLLARVDINVALVHGPN